VKYVDPDGEKDKPQIAGISGCVPLVGDIDTGNSYVDSFLAGAGSIWNAAASVVNAPINYVGELLSAADNLLTQIDDAIPDEYSLTGRGLREDLYVVGLYSGMNPVAAIPRGTAAATATRSTARPIQWHHFATNKHTYFTPRMAEIANKYGLSLDGSWNKMRLPHQGGHATEYNNFVLKHMRDADSFAGGDQAKFLQYFKQNVIGPVVNNPDLLYKSGWP
jgi:hypothetical protein